MKLVIVESPTKARTISRFLSRDFKVVSSYGHTRDLPSYKLGVDVENNFEPQYVISKKVRPVVKELKEKSKKADEIILATDEDREGEAIAWHLAQALGFGEIKTLKRIVFHEITKSAIGEALKNPRSINQDLVDAQQARRILDRLVGYKLSPFLWKKIMRGLSAGRVQSVALRLIVEREEEIKKFKPEIYFTVEASFHKQSCKDSNKDGKECIPINAKLTKVDGKAVAKPGIKDKKEAEDITSEIKKLGATIEKVSRRKSKRFPRPPFTTSTLQQESFNRLGYSAKKTMSLAQQLYETGLITYMRTDSLNISPDALTAASRFVKEKFGEKYALKNPKIFKTKSKSAQEAHEAIRPTQPENDPEKTGKLQRDQKRLYTLIWSRFIASQMSDAEFEETSLEIELKGKNKIYTLSSSGSIMSFDGFLKVYPQKNEDTFLPEISEGENINLLKAETLEHKTKGPARYSEASLVKELEKLGIGRPSTYAPTMSTIETRGYVNKDDNKRFEPTEIGTKVNEILVKNFPKIVDVGFTAEIEEDLDEIAEGKKEWRPVVREFYGPFIKNLEEKYESVEKEDMSEKTDRICPECTKQLIIRHGRYGKFIACSGFPDCKYTEPLPPESIDMKCPKCKEGDVVIKQTKRRRVFYGCSRWPECDFASWQKPTGNYCLECSSPTSEYRGGEKCTNKQCNFVKKASPKNSGDSEKRSNKGSG